MEQDPEPGGFPAPNTMVSHTAMLTILNLANMNYTVPPESSTVVPTVLNFTLFNFSISPNETITAGGWSQWQKALIIVSGGLLALLTAGGNLLVLLSFQVDKQLRIISNYFLFSLAIADLCIGLISVPFMTLYVAENRWPLGYVACQFWLCLDYLMSNASVWNLLLISLDRFFSVTKPLTYRPKRTTRKAVIMMASTYVLSLLLWPPWIVAWPYIEGRLDEINYKEECVVQFLRTNATVTIATIMAAFYIPVFIMVGLYARIYFETQRRQKELRKLQGFEMRTKTTEPSETKRSTGSVPHLSHIPGSALIPGNLAAFSANPQSLSPQRCTSLLTTPCSDIPSYNTTETTPVHTTMSRKRLLIGALFRFHSRGRNKTALRRESDTDTISMNEESSECFDRYTALSPQAYMAKQDSVQTLPTVKINGTDAGDAVVIHFANNSIPKSEANMPARQVNKSLSGLNITKPSRCSLTDDCKFSLNPKRKTKKQARRPSRDSVASVECSEAMMDKDSDRKRSFLSNTGDNAQDSVRFRGFRRKSMIRSETSRKKRSEKKQDSKAAKTLSAILLAFVLTWAPYSVIVIIDILKPGFTNVDFYTFSYYLCYINSTINPILYALCNPTFRATYLRILTCRCWKKEEPAFRAHSAMNLSHATNQTVSRS